MNLSYVEVRHVPFVESKRFGRGTDAETLKKVERLVVRALLTQRRPLRGIEVLFFRSVLGMSQKQLGSRLGYSEVAMRALMAGIFGIKLEGQR